MDEMVKKIVDAVTGHKESKGGWFSVPDFLRGYETDRLREWTPERDAIADLMAEDSERPSGISGIDPDYFRVKAFLIYRGRQAIDIMHKRGLQ